MRWNTRSWPSLLNVFPHWKATVEGPSPHFLHTEAAHWLHCDLTWCFIKERRVTQNTPGPTNTRRKCGSHWAVSAAQTRPKLPGRNILDCHRQAWLPTPLLLTASLLRSRWLWQVLPDAPSHRGLGCAVFPTTAPETVSSLLVNGRWTRFKSTPRHASQRTGHRGAGGLAGLLFFWDLKLSQSFL